MKRLFKRYGLWGLVAGWLLLSFAVVCPYFCPQAEAREISAHCVSHDQASHPDSNDGACCDHSLDVLIQTSSVDHFSSPYLFQLGIQPIQLSGVISDFVSFKSHTSSYFTLSPPGVKMPLRLLSHVFLN